MKDLVEVRNWEGFVLVEEKEGICVIKFYFLFFLNVPEIDIYISSPLSQGVDSLANYVYRHFRRVVFFFGTSCASRTNSRGEIGLEMLL